MLRKLTRNIRLSSLGTALNSATRQFAPGGVEKTNHFKDDDAANKAMDQSSASMADPMIYHVPTTSMRTVGRDADVIALWQRLLSGKNVQIVSAIDGVGKSTIAAEFCDAAKRSGRFSCIHWFNGVHSAEEQLKTFFQMMSDRKEKDILLVVDDVQNVDALIQFLPRVQGLYVLVTTSTEVDEGALGASSSVYRPAALTAASAAELFAHLGTVEDTAEICEAVGYVPLLMHLAMSLISQDILSAAALKERIQNVEGVREGVFSVSKVLQALVDVSVSHLDAALPGARLWLAALSCCHLADISVSHMDAVAGPSASELLLRCSELGLLTQKWDREALSLHPSIARALRAAGPVDACETAAKALLSLWPRRWRAMDTDRALMLVYHTVAVSNVFQSLQRPLTAEMMASMDRSATFCAHSEGKQLHLALLMWEGIVSNYVAQNDTSSKELARVALEAGRICSLKVPHKAESLLQTAWSASKAAWGEQSVEAALAFVWLCAYLPNDQATLEALRVSGAALRAKLASVDDILRKEERIMMMESLYVLLSRHAHIAHTTGGDWEPLAQEMETLSRAVDEERKKSK